MVKNSCTENQTQMNTNDQQDGCLCLHILTKWQTVHDQMCRTCITCVVFLSASHLQSVPLTTNLKPWSSKFSFRLVYISTHSINFVISQLAYIIEMPIRASSWKCIWPRLQIVYHLTHILYMYFYTIHV